MYEPGVHSGQVGQPSPEPVNRTAPPVTTIAACDINRANESGDKARAAREDFMAQPYGS